MQRGVYVIIKIMIHLHTHTHSRAETKEYRERGGMEGVLPKGVFSSLLIARFGLNTKINLIKCKAKFKLRLHTRFSLSFLFSLLLVPRFTFLLFAFVFAKIFLK